MTGIPCPSCFLTRATSAALTGDFNTSVDLHIFGPLTAAALLGWSVLSIRQQKLVPKGLNPQLFTLWGLLMLVYWLARLGLDIWPNS